jgi:hypothetical protein
MVISVPPAAGPPDGEKETMAGWMHCALLVWIVVLDPVHVVPPVQYESEGVAELLHQLHTEELPKHVGQADEETPHDTNVRVWRPPPREGALDDEPLKIAVTVTPDTVPAV